MIAAERLASVNTLDAYRRDLEDFAGFIGERGAAIDTAASDQIRAYLADLEARGFAATSQQRRLSALRQFHRFLVESGIREDDPTQTLDSPKRGRPLPKILSQDQVKPPTARPPKSSCSGRSACDACWNCCTPRVCACRN